MDWKSAIAELQKLGLSQPQIALACGCRQSTISDLGSGKTNDPRHALGERIRKLLEQERELVRARAAGSEGRQATKNDAAPAAPCDETAAEAAAARRL